MGKAVTIEAGGALGTAFGGDGGGSWQIRAGVTWELTSTAAVYCGFRLLELDVENDGFVFDSGLQGLFVAGVLQF